MQKTIFTIFIVFQCLLISGFKAIENSTLRVEVTNFENKASTKIYVSVFSKKDFLEKSIQTKSAIISNF